MSQDRSKQPRQDAAAEPRPGVEVGDHLYVHHGGQPCTGRVLAHGRHGVTVHIDGRQHRVKWDKVLGHKSRAPLRYDVIDHGEDGMLVKDHTGRRRFVAVPNEAKEDPMVVKAFGARRVALFLKAEPAAPGGGMAGRPGLTKKQITDRTGRQQTKWVRTDKGGPPAQRGQHVGFENGEHRGHGEVIASGQHGVTVQDAAGGVHRVHHEKVTHRWGGEGAPDGSPHGQQPGGRPDVKPHEGDPDSFSAAAFSAQHDDPDATEASIVAGFGGDARERIEEARQRAGAVRQTVEDHKKDGVWSEERAALHRKILFEGVEIKGKKVPGILSPERIEAATPPPGQRPTFVALGGRGGSGKSSLNGRVYDESSALVLDADHIKGLLPEYEGWNAHQVHEESSEIVSYVLSLAREMGVNVVYDATMKTGRTIEQLVDRFNEAGFRTEAHYMHLPRQEATRRAIGRFLNGGDTGRFVPPEVVLANVDNEKNFDAIKGKVHAWSFHDNSGSKEAGPKLIARKGDAAMAPGGRLIKSDQSSMILLWKGACR